jgi:arylsulfatase A-like enzyme
VVRARESVYTFGAMVSRFRARALVLSLVALAGSACRPAPERRNLIVISIDSLRADHVGCYGYAAPTTPSLDRLAAEGVVFRRAYAPSPWTLPSHASLFTGLEPAAHGVDHGQAHLADGATTLAELLRERGHRTAAVVCAPLLRRKFGLDQGFDTYDVELIGKNYLEARRAKVADRVTDKALALVDAAPDRPFFLFLHYWDPHYDYNPAQAYLDLFDPGYVGPVDGLDIHDRTDLTAAMPARDLQHLVARYDAEIRWTDAEIGRLLDGLRARGRDRDTAVVVTSDHGEEFLDHGGTGHTRTCYEEVLRIPLIARVPWLAAGPRVVDEHVSLLDLYPTILDLLGASHDGVAIQGLSLAGSLAGTARIPPRFLLGESRLGQLGADRGNVSSLLSPDRMKYVLFHGTATHAFVFDLERDPRETHDLLDAAERDAAELAARLAARHEENRRWNAALRVGRASELEPELSETLKGLGYLP